MFGELCGGGGWGGGGLCSEELNSGNYGQRPVIE